MAEKEYIEREAIQKRLNRIIEVNNLRTDLAWFTPYGVNALIEEIPAADVRPVVRGRWIRHYEQADTGEDIITYPCGWVCSECGRWESEDEPFCNCGAKMEES